MNTIFEMDEIDLTKLEPKTRVALEKAGLLSCKAIIQLSDCELCKLLNISKKESVEVLQVTAEHILKSRFLSVSELTTNQNYYKRWRRLTLGCRILDSMLNGGISARGICELAGQSSCGKTQLCLQLAITVQLSEKNGGFDAGAVFICTEDKFPSSRLQQLIQLSPISTHRSNIKFGDHIFIEHIPDVEGLKKCINFRLPELLANNKIGLIVIDSIAAVFRAEYNYNEGRTRARDLRVIGLQLHSFSNKYNLAVVCINQVTDILCPGGGEGKQSVPALGLAWANLVTQRLLMIRTESSRTLQVVFAPDLPLASCPYLISKTGIVGIESS